MLDQNSGSLHPCFQLFMPHPCSRRDMTLPPEVPGLAPETSRSEPGGYRLAPGNIPASAGGVALCGPRARKGHQCSSIPTVWSTFPAARHGTRPGGSWQTTPSTETGNSPGSGSSRTGAGKPPCGARSYAQFALRALYVRRNGETCPDRHLAQAGADRTAARAGAVSAAVEEVVKHAHAEGERVDRDALVHAVEHAEEVQVSGEAQGREPEAADAECAERLGIR